MESITAQVLAEPTAAPPARGRLRLISGAAVHARPALAAALAAGACAVASLGGPAAILAGLVGASGAAALAWRREPEARPLDAAATSPAAGSQAPQGVDDAGARLMVSRVVPVWRRQLETARGATEEGFNEMVQAFARVSDGLNTLVAQTEQVAPVASGPGAVDEVIASRTDMVDELLLPLRRAVKQRDDAARALTESAESIRQLERGAKECKALARHTRMVATNAAIEAKRFAGAGQGKDQEQRGRFDAVAAEVRMLAERSAELGERLQRSLDALAGRLEPVRRHAELHDITEDELQLEARMQARKVLAALLGDLSRSLQASHEMRALASTMREDVDAVFLGFQAGDRVSQMLDILERDLRKLVDWNSTHAGASHADADAWLAELEQTYTMTEQRSQHHNTVSVDAGAGVEFF